VRVDTRAGRELARHLIALEGVRRIDLDLDGLTVMTTRPGDLFDAIARLSAEERLPVDGFRPTDESLEAVFRYLTT
jgi:hypothetical protein